jgi:hypothetical protein
MTTGPVHESQSFMYLETTIPAGVTISEYRRSRPRNPRGWSRLRSVGQRRPSSTSTTS